LSFKSYDFLSIKNNALFVLDFSNIEQVNNFAVQLGQFNETVHLFNYLFQLFCLELSWLNPHLVLIFT
jgi:hypothetical protein